MTSSPFRFFSPPFTQCLLRPSLLALIPFLAIGSLLLHHLILFHFAVQLDQQQQLRIYITRAFFHYQLDPDRDPDQHDNEPDQNATIVVLATADRRLAFFPQPQIACQNIENGQQILVAKFEPLHLHSYPYAPCRLALFRIQCHFQHPIGAQPPKHIGLRIGDGRQPIIELTVQPADQQPRQLVLCPGRTFLFDQWHLLITAMELHRLQRVSLVIVHILSVHPPLLSLLRAYELDGLAQLRPSHRMPKSLEFDPNAETLWNNQLIDFHDCLYEFRQSASFIGFPDWDDLLMTPFATPLPDALHQFVSDQPNAAALLPMRFPGNFPSLAQLTSSSFAVPTAIRLFSSSGAGLLRYTVWPSDAQYISKLLVRPRFVSGVDLHGPGPLVPNFTLTELSPTRAFFVHARNYKNHHLAQHLASAFKLATNFDEFLARHNLSLGKMPKFEQFLPTLNDCLERVVAKVRANRRSKCYNYANCRRELAQTANRGKGHWWNSNKGNEGRKFECAGADNRWRMHTMPMPFEEEAPIMRVWVLTERRVSILNGINNCMP